MKIPFHRPFITDEEIEAASAMLREGWLTAGAKTVEFETAFKAFVGCEHAVAVNSATAALNLSLEAAGVSEGDEVLVPAMTFVATAEVVRYLRATPVLVDIERDTRVSLDIDEHGRRAKIAHHLGGRHKGHGGNKHLIPLRDAGCFEREIEGRGGGIHRHGMLASYKGLEGRLELDSFCSGGEPALSKHGRGRLYLFISDEGPMEGNFHTP